MTGIVLCGLAWPDSVGFLAPFSLMGLVASFSFACLVLYVYTPPHAWLWIWSAGHDGQCLYLQASATASRDNIVDMLLSIQSCCLCRWGCHVMMVIYCLIM